MLHEYYIQLFSPHGLIRYKNPEIGRDRDTGGQVKYVLEMLEALSAHPRVRKVDLLTRRISDRRVATNYENEIEIVNDKARIVRISCGGGSYKPKEQLWDHLEEFVDKTVRFNEKQRDYPDVVHGHYADGNYIAHEISEMLGIPFLATGHSLGRNKKEILTQQGLNEAQINDRFNMERRIDVEERVLQSADMFVVSTDHIVQTQYSKYENFESAKFRVIPPGVNSDLFYPFYRFDMPSFKMTVEQEQTVYRINSDIDRFLFNPEKPLILSIGRADKRKNFERIIQAYGQDKELQALANLGIFAGVRKDIAQMPEEEQDILTNLLLLLDKYDLYGKMAIPKKNDPRLEVPEIYRLAARKKGVFINATPGENFGLTLVEAAACGLPVVASPDGGPKEIIEQCENGLLVNVENTEDIANALKKIITDQSLWEKFSSNGILGSTERYTWGAFTESYVTLLDELRGKSHSEEVAYSRKTAYGKKLAGAEWFFITDMDGTLFDGPEDDGLSDLCEWITAQQDKVVFGIASGRNLEITRKAIEHYHLPTPDVLICSVGSEIYYTDKYLQDAGWESHIRYQWKRSELANALARFPGIRLQEESAQWPFKLSYYVNDSFDDDRMADLYKFLDDRKLHARVILTENRFLDLLPIRASKGNAVRYLSYKWKKSLERFITAGNSGNDADMLTGKTRSIVVANYSPELQPLKNNRNIYFSPYRLAEGVFDGIKHYLK
jgi:sucrose-phosphate synthase